jgi:plasmid stability protein
MKKQATRRTGRRVTKSAARGGAVQYTVRDVPSHVDRALRRRASEEGKSLNQLLRDALAKEAGGDMAAPVLHHDLDALAGTWDNDPEFDRALAEQDRVDEAMWR